MAFSLIYILEFVEGHHPMPINHAALVLLISFTWKADEENYSSLYCIAWFTFTDFCPFFGGGGGGGGEGL